MEKRVDKGILEIRDLLDQNGMFYDHTQLKLKYGINCNFLNVLQIRQSIPHSWRKLLTDCKENYPKQKDILVRINGTKKQLSMCKCKDFYWNFLNATSIEPSSKTSWKKQFPLLEDFDKSKWASVYKIPFQSTRETCIQSFQYKLINRIIACNR